MFPKFFWWQYILLGTMLRNIILVIFGVGLALGFLEAVFRFLPVSESLQAQRVSDTDPVFRFRSNRVVNWSRGWNFSRRNLVRVNNDGFVSAIRYEKAEESPLLTVIGDSYIEAAMIPWEKTGHGLLHRDAEKHGGRVYSFGASGAALSQYLAYARYVKEQYHPEAVVFLIVGNDFDESLEKYKRAPGMHYFRKGPEGALVLSRTNYQPQGIRRSLRYSAFARYLFINLQMSALLLQLRYGSGSSHFVGNTSADASPGRLSDGRAALDAFLDGLELVGFRPEQLLLVLDGIRPQLYSPENDPGLSESFFARMREETCRAAAGREIECLDLQPSFQQEFRQNGERFEFSDDGHWNARGHAVFAQEVKKSETYQRFAELLGNGT